MESEIANIRAKLKPTTTKIPTGFKGSDLTPEESIQIYERYFDSGAQNWYPPFIDITFETIFIPLSRSNAKSIILHHQKFNENPLYSLPPNSDLEPLLSSITNSLKKANWKQSFVKLSTRSPKDSIKILARGLKTLETQIGDTIEEKKNFANHDYNYKIAKFSQCVQDNFFISSGEEALDVLISSERVFEDLEYAFANEVAYPFEKTGLHLILREWSQSIPITSEFRGFVWEGSLNAIGQYYHSLYFPELIGKKEEIQEKLKNFFTEKIQKKLTEDLKCCIVDFAILNENTIKLIEINPFDGKALASLKGSTGLFDLDNPNDLKVVQKGPLELRIRENALSDGEIKMKLNVTWKETIKSYF